MFKYIAKVYVPKKSVRLIIWSEGSNLMSCSINLFEQVYWRSWATDMRNYQEKTYLGAMAEPGVGMDMDRAQSRGAYVDNDQI